MQTSIFDEEIEPLTGRHLVPAGGALSYWPTIHPGDVLQLNLDVRSIGGAGLFLCEFRNDNGKPWRGVRCFRVDADGKHAYDTSGRGNYLPLTNHESKRMKVLGRVEQVFKPLTEGNYHESTN